MFEVIRKKEFFEFPFCVKKFEKEEFQPSILVICFFFLSFFLYSKNDTAHYFEI